MTDNKDVLDPGPFFHGTKAQLKIGEELKAQNQSNFQDKKSNYIYFTASLEAAKWGAELAEGDLKERIYIVEPIGEFDNDPNLTDKRFPGNPTRSYRSMSPLKVVAELGAWDRHTDEELKHMRDSLKTLREQGKDIIID
ncbi:NAD(+)--rifampin ADP-ribosyltransferase [Planococcus sp. X10-3]|uniref:NAD(+)--rifampin ADP-ribosyltransferase n=1 Tax=Planococcus sp. X10-3 TaxID=3061240 RepID=UPI003BB004F6